MVCDLLRLACYLGIFPSSLLAGRPGLLVPIPIPFLTLSVSKKPGTQKSSRSHTHYSTSAISTATQQAAAAGTAQVWAASPLPQPSEVPPGWHPRYNPILGTLTASLCPNGLGDLTRGPQRARLTAQPPVGLQVPEGFIWHPVF